MGCASLKLESEEMLRIVRTKTVMQHLKSEAAD